MSVDLPPGFEGTPAVPEHTYEADAQFDPPVASSAEQQTDGQDAPQAPDQSGIYASDLTFGDLGLSPDILDALLLDMKFERPSKIQALTLPKVLAEPDRHMIAQGHNGCGKTTCFTLAMLMRVNVDISKPQAICICPTRELVVQNLSVLRKMAARTQPPITSRGTSEAEARERGRPPPITDHVIIGTPGTLANWIARRRVALDAIRVLVFDEADVMLMDSGFQDLSVRMLHQIRAGSPDVQLLLFSATFSDDIRQYCNKIVPGATRVYIEKEELSLDVIRQHKVLVAGNTQKADILKQYILSNADKLGQMIIFVRTRRAADALHREMNAEGFRCSLLSGEMEREARDMVVEQFRDVQTRILISTDVISRGFDVSTVTLVVNFDLPVKHGTNEPDYETYLHRIGRSGRFGNKGVAFNFVDRSFVHHNGRTDEDVMTSIEDYFDKKVEEVPADDEDAFIKALEDAGLMGVDAD